MVLAVLLACLAVVLAVLLARLAVGLAVLLGYLAICRLQLICGGPCPDRFSTDTSASIDTHVSCGPGCSAGLRD